MSERLSEDIISMFTLDDISIRPLNTAEDREACVALQKETWGEDFQEAVPPSLLLVSEKIGGVAAGAFATSGELAGFVFGLTGVRNGSLVHWSDMLAVRAGWQNRGIGWQLKQYQREQVRALGVRHMYWSFDPLEAKNAYFNINGLRVKVEEYVRDMYGSGASNRLHEGIGTDRCVVVWSLEEGAGGKTQCHPHLEEWIDYPNVSEPPAGGGTPFPQPRLYESTARIRVEIPNDIQDLKTRDPNGAAAWRTVTRYVFEHYLGRGYNVTGFLREETTGRCFYLLSR